MSSESRHRGAHPADREIFQVKAWPDMQLAMSDLSWLLSHGYARPSSLKLVGDRYALTERQRLAVARAACPDDSLARRSRTQLKPEQMRGRDVMADGFNLLVSLEAFLGGGVLLLCRDGCVRDMSSVHGSYHAVAETDAAIMMVAKRLAELEVRSVHWLFDSPVSNSGRLALRIRELAEQHVWPWTVETVFNPDTVLIAAKEPVVVSSDALILESAPQWFNLAANLILASAKTDTWLVDLSRVSEAASPGD